MLFRMVDELAARADALDANASLNAFARHTMQRYPGIQASPGGPGPATLRLCKLALTVIKSIPAMTRELRRVADNPGTSPALRMTILGSLAYLVQPRDLIPDDAPAGYGLIDDAAMLLATMRAVNQRIDRSKRVDDRTAMGLAMVTMCLPPGDRAVLQQMITGIDAAFEILNQLPQQLLALSAESIIQAPLAASLPYVPGLQPSMGSTLPGPDSRVRSVPGGRVEIR
jgi:uncharacterized membrane protein YkvA (DUF1232 family)